MTNYTEDNMITKYLQFLQEGGLQAYDVQNVVNDEWTDISDSLTEYCYKRVAIKRKKKNKSRFPINAEEKESFYTCRIDILKKSWQYFKNWVKSNKKKICNDFAKSYSNQVPKDKTFKKCVNIFDKDVREINKHLQRDIKSFQIKVEKARKGI